MAESEDKTRGQAPPLRKVDLRRGRHAPVDRRGGEPDPMDELLDASGDERPPEDEPSRQ